MHQSTGTTLVEVLVSFVLLACLLLGLDAFALVNVRATKALYYFSVATNQLRSFAERLHTLNGADLSSPFIAWNEENLHVLPHGTGAISGHYPDYRLVIYWGKIADHCFKNKIGRSGCVQLTIQITKNALIL
jgi:hypothetical protein